MIRFNNDYNRSAHKKVLEAIINTAPESYGGYGIDPWCEKAEREIKKYLDCEKAKVHFLVGGTQANFTVITAALRSYQGVISADSGHIHVHETGAVENTGHKIHALPATDGKISAKQIADEARLYAESGVKEHITQPKMVYLSHPTELGTVYTLKELEEISAVCKEYSMYLFVDGARMAYGLAASDVTAKDLARLCDVFYFGGTKCGAMFGEAVVITNPDLQTDFRSYIKQNGAMLAKGWLLGLQFATLFENGLYFELGKEAVELALKIKNAFVKKGIPLFVDSPTNQQFVVLSEAQMEKLSKNYVFEYENRVDDTHHCVRFCTGWSTKPEEVETLIKDIEVL